MTFSQVPGDLNASVMHTLEQFIKSGNIGQITNLTKDAHAAEIELLAIQRYFKIEWSIDTGLDDLIRDYDIRACSIMDEKYHRVIQCMDVMKAQILRTDKDKSLMDRALGV
jgi:hypothetical protein